MTNSVRQSPLPRAVGATLLICFVCAAVPVTADLVPALQVFGLRWMPAGQIAVYGAIAMGVYLASAMLGAALGWIVWLAVAKTRLGGPRLKSLLTGAAVPAGVVCTLWAMASQDISLVPDILRGPTQEVAACYALTLVAGWAAATGAAYVLHELLKQFPRFRRVMGVSGLVVLGSALLALIGLSVWQRWPLVRSRPDRPNVLLITIDALRRDFPSCYGGHVQTPNIDRLASEGAKFTALSSCAPWTRPSCSSIHLGVYPSIHGVGEGGPKAEGKEANCFPATLTTLAEALQASGYSTQAFVSNSQIDRSFGFDRGFDNYCMYEDISARTPWLPIDEAGIPGRAFARHALRLARFDFVDRPPSDDDKLRGLKRVFLAGSGAFVTGQAIRWLRPAREPFFLWLHYMDVHQYCNYKFRTPKDTGQLKGEPGLSRLLLETAFERAQEGEPFTWTLPGMPGRAAAAAKYRQSYGGNLPYLDGLVGCLLGGLDGLGLADRTQVVFTSDHGEGFDEHDFLWHGDTVYEEVIALPLIVRAPSLTKPGTIFPQVCSLVDVAPTISELAGISVPATFDGHPLVSVFSRADAPPRAVYSEFTAQPDLNRRAVRYGPMKCISATKEQAAELYDLSSDPGERHDLASDRPDVLKKLLERLDSWRQQQSALATRLRTGKRTTTTMGDEMTERLRTLGYVE